MSIGRVKKQYHGLNFSWRRPGKIFLITTFILAAVFFAARLKNIEYFPIKNVKIFGIKHIDYSEVQTLVSPLVKKSFFAVDVDRIKDSILQMPWVDQVVVRRIWPDQVVVAISERTPVAIWNDTSILSAADELFTPARATYPAGLPELVGPHGEQLLMARYYAKMASVLAPIHFKIKRLELSPTMTWSITLDNGIKLYVGQKDILTRLDHFVKVYSKIVGDRTADVGYIDLRYPNGMAVRWKSAT